MLVFRFYMQNERNARGIYRHYLLQILHIQMHAFHHDALVAHVRAFYDLAQLVLYQLRLLSVSFDCDLRLREVSSVFQAYLTASLICGTEEDRVILFLQVITHYVTDAVR